MGVTSEKRLKIPTMLQCTIWTARKTNRRSLEVYFDDRCQFSVVKFRSDSVQVCDLGSSKKGRSLKKKIQSRWGGGDVKGEGRRCCALSAPWVRSFWGISVCVFARCHSWVLAKISLFLSCKITVTKVTHSHLYSMRAQHRAVPLSTAAWTDVSAP